MMDRHQSRKKSSRELALHILQKIEQQGAYSNLLLHQTLARHELERPDAALLTELVYGTLQRRNTLDYHLGKWLKKGTDRIETWVLNLLRISLYQILYLDRIPAHAIVNEAVNIAKRKGHRGISGMVNGVLRNILRHQDQLALPSDLHAAARIALQHSHPEWLVTRWLEQFGEEQTEAMCEANLEPPRVSARINVMKTSVEQMIEKMQEAGMQAEASAIAPSGIVVHSGGNLAHTPWHENGELSIQDESSMLPAQLLNPQPGMKVLDACAAPGGKTAQIAEMMNDEGEIWANDVHEHKEKLIASQAARLKLSSVKTSVCDARKLHERHDAESFDCVLLDAPCSGFGVIRRKPDLKWSKKESEIAAIAEIQYEILASVSRLVKPGGVLVYSTCTMERIENEKNIERFLTEQPGWQLDETGAENLPQPVVSQCMTDAGFFQILPHHFGSDGFFMARLKKS